MLVTALHAGEMLVNKTKIHIFVDFTLYQGRQTINIRHVRGDKYYGKRNSRTERERCLPNLCLQSGPFHWTPASYIHIPTWHLYWICICNMDIQTELHICLMFQLFVTTILLYLMFCRWGIWWGLSSMICLCFMMSGSSAGVAHTSGDDWDMGPLFYLWCVLKLESLK